MSGLPLTWFAASGLLGALLAAPLPLDGRVTVAAGACIAATLLRREPRHIRAAAVLALGLSYAYTLIRTESEPSVQATRTQRFGGTVIGDALLPGGLHEYQLRLDGAYVVRMSAHDAVPLGAHVIVRGRLEPFDGPRNPGEPSERDIERDNGVAARIANASILAHDGTASTFEVKCALLKAWAFERLRTGLGNDGAAIVAGQLWGERASLSPDLRAEFQETGTVHVLVTAGLHVGLVAVVVMTVAERFGASRIAVCALASACVWLFAFASGLHVPALRAASMTTMALAARATGRATVSWNAVAAGVVAVLAVAPYDATSASFWLSFSCVAAIVALAPLLESILARIALPPRLREALVLTLATQAGTWPVTAAVFLQFTPYALLANLAVVPCVPLTMTLGAVQLATSFSAPLAQAAANINSWLVAWMIGAVRTFANAPGASIVMTPAPIWAIAAYEAALMLGATLVRRGAVNAALGLVIVSTSYVLWPPRSERPMLRITALDVGQADAIVIETPAHHAVLVDAGGRLERGAFGGDSVAEAVGERVVVPFLIRRGIHRLDALIVTHPHGDHVGGCAPVLRRLQVAEIADSGQTYGGHAYHDCLDTAAADGVPVVYPRAGDVWRTEDGVMLAFLGPSLPFIEGANAINDNSIAFMLQYRRFRMLFTGDAGDAAEQRFLDEGIDLHADVLKVGHHGSAYSSSPEFIAAVHPTYAVISVGRHNLFGHPAPSTIDALKASSAIYRTDENGAVEIESDGAGMTITPAIEAGGVEVYSARGRTFPLLAVRNRQAAAVPGTTRCRASRTRCRGL